jgi:hypothetical protein
MPPALKEDQSMNRVCLIGLALLALGPFLSAGGDPPPIKLLIITGDHGHDWKATTAYFKEFLPKDRIAISVTETPGKDLTPDNLKKYDVLLLNYKDTPKGATESPDSVWSNDNMQAFLGTVATLERACAQTSAGRSGLVRPKRVPQPGLGGGGGLANGSCQVQDPAPSAPAIKIGTCPNSYQANAGWRR